MSDPQFIAIDLVNISKPMFDNKKPLEHRNIDNKVKQSYGYYPKKRKEPEPKNCLQMIVH